MVSEEPVCEGPLEACYGRVLLGMEVGMGKQDGMQGAQIHVFLHLFTPSSNKNANTDINADHGICKMLRKCKRSK